MSKQYVFKIKVFMEGVQLWNMGRKEKKYKAYGKAFIQKVSYHKNN